MRLPTLELGLVVLALSSASSKALACGGCFAPPSTVSEVTGHRMVFSVSEERTVLWDKFEYLGAPEEFSWVLPVAPGAYVEEAANAWFDALDAATNKEITGPQLTCAVSDSGPSCGVMSSQDAAARGDDSGSVLPPPVQVIDQRTVGPYEVVTLRTTQGDELFRWFDANGYFVPIDIAPIIDAYVSEGSDFVAVKLRPGQGVQQMTPVRVVTPGGPGVLPLRMVAAGVRDQVDIVLYVIGDVRYGMPDLSEVSLDTEDLVWNYQTQNSNYLVLRDSALAENAGFSFLTTFAESGVLLRPGFRSMTASNGNFTDSIAKLYFAEAAANDELPNPCPTWSEPTGNGRVVEDRESQILPASGALVCGDYSDLAQALVGLDPERAWLTRLELKLPKVALDMDCIVEPNKSQTKVSNELRANRSTGRPEGCEEPLFTSGVAVAPRELKGSSVWLLGAAMAFWMTRRRLRATR